MPNSPTEWMALARQHEIAANVLAQPMGNPPEARNMVLFHVGSAVECALKALIMHRKGLTAWPGAISFFIKATSRKLYQTSLFKPRRRTIGQAFEKLLQRRETGARSKARP